MPVAPKKTWRKDTNIWEEATILLYNTITTVHITVVHYECMLFSLVPTIINGMWICCSSDYVVTNSTLACFF